MSIPHPTPESIKTLSVAQIAREIRTYWPVIDYAAQPYLAAMACISSVDDNYGLDSGRSIVAYALNNMSTFRGPIAKIIKAELCRRIK